MFQSAHLNNCENTYENNAETMNWFSGRKVFVKLRLGEVSYSEINPSTLNLDVASKQLVKLRSNYKCMNKSA